MKRNALKQQQEVGNDRHARKGGQEGGKNSHIIHPQSNKPPLAKSCPPTPTPPVTTKAPELGLLLSVDDAMLTEPVVASVDVDIDVCIVSAVVFSHHTRGSGTMRGCR